MPYDLNLLRNAQRLALTAAVAALAADPNVSQKSGKVLSSWNLALEYGFKDIDGRQPNWGKYFEEHIASKE